jgi:hypothetical protein
MMAAHTFRFTIDGKTYDWIAPTISGADLRALVPGLNPAFLLVEDVQPEDVVIRDDMTVDLRRAPSFYTVPPATFGAKRYEPPPPPDEALVDLRKRLRAAEPQRRAR